MLSADEGVTSITFTASESGPCWLSESNSWAIKVFWPPNRSMVRLKLPLRQIVEPTSCPLSTIFMTRLSDGHEPLTWIGLLLNTVPDRGEVMVAAIDGGDPGTVAATVTTPLSV